MNTVSQTIAKLVILPLFGAAVITGVALTTADSAVAVSESKAMPPATATTPAQPDPIESAIRDGELATAGSTAPAAPARPDVILNGIRISAASPAPAAPAPAAAPPAGETRSGQQDSGTSGNQDSTASDRKKKDNVKSSKG